MRQAPCARHLRRLLRGTLLATAILIIGPAIVACGQPQGTPVPAGAAVPAGADGAAGAPPRGTKPAGPYGPTPFPTVPAALQPTPDRRPSVIPTPRPERTPDPNAPCANEVFSDLPSVNVLTRSASVIAIGTVKQVLPARWTTPDGRRPA